MYNNPYFANYNNQQNLDRINAQMAELERIKQQIQQPPVQQPLPTNLTQNFQISPTNRDVIKYASSMDEVQREMVIGDTPYFSKDMSIVWIKNTKGEIKTYELNEIIPKDNKDLQIEYLQAQIEELKGRLDNERVTTNANKQQISKYTEEYDEPIRESIENDKPSSISKVSRGKKEQ